MVADAVSQEAGCVGYWVQAIEGIEGDVLMRLKATYRGARRLAMKKLGLLSRQLRDRRYEILEAAARRAGSNEERSK